MDYQLCCLDLTPDGKTLVDTELSTVSDLWLALNTDPEMKKLADQSGFELVNVGVDQMDAFMRDKIRVYTQTAQQMGLGKK